MSTAHDENVGKQIGIFDILGVCDRRTNDGHKLYHVKCVLCGYNNDMRLSEVKRTKRCAHLSQDGGYRNFGEYVWKNQRLHGIFKGMKSRCYNVNSKDYKHYGAKGIKIYDEWLRHPSLFEDWAMRNGYADNLTIDRIDENQSYCPENCRWITLEDNSRYKSTTRVIDVDGEIHTGKEWSRKLGLGENQINKYIQKHGIDNVIEFIRRFKANPNLRADHRQSYYDLYMTNK